jgi:hypothetical protein
MRSLAVCFIFLAIAAACSAALQESEAGRQVLMEFFTALHEERYTQATEIYGGSYEALSAMNPDLDPSDHAALWQRGCQVNGLHCYPVRSATFKEQSGDNFVYTVEFTGTDGARFVLGPCCGATETEMPPRYQFEFRVVKQAGKYLVVDPPVLVP